MQLSFLGLFVKFFNSQKKIKVLELLTTHFRIKQQNKVCGIYIFPLTFVRYLSEHTLKTFHSCYLINNKFSAKNSAYKTKCDSSKMHSKNFAHCIRVQWISFINIKSLSHKLTLFHALKINSVRS